MGDEHIAAPKLASPSSSGPAGALFEGRVGAHYLLTMLAEADPRGLPGVSIGRLELQRAGEGHPLDDVIVRGTVKTGEPAVLEVQVKRTITFSPGDPVFKDVVGQLARAYRTLDLSNQRHQFAVATERTSFKITGPYQDLLRWAREVSSASVFFGRLNRKKVGNDDMRAFVGTVRTQLEGAGCASDDETVWQLLRRFQILTFDFDAPGSQSLELALERARNVLDPADAPRASAFFKVLTEAAIRVAASGGDLDREKLLHEVASLDSFRLLGSRRNRTSRETLGDAAKLAAADLRRSIAGVSLARSAQLDAVRNARDHGRYIEIRGGPGVGKSGLLGMLVDQVITEGRAIVLTPERTMPGGWLSFKAALQIEGSPEAFLSDLASDGGAVLFVDSLDFFDDFSKRATVADLVRAASSIPAIQVFVTARADFDKDEPNWLPKEVLEKLGRAPPIVLAELGAEEIEELGAAAPTLRALLADNHPARDVARNLFRLSRLLEVQGSTDQLRSEVDLLERWWTTADGPSINRRERARLLADLSDAVLSGADRLETRSSAVDALIGSGTLRELGLDKLTFQHDVLREWGVAARVHHDPDKIEQLPLTRAATASLARGIELGARFALERSDDGQAWVEYLNRLSPEGSHASWRRWSLLAIVRSELAYTLLDRAWASLTDNDGALLRELVRTTLAVESRRLVETLAEHAASAEGVPAGIYAPTNGSWSRLARWLLARQANLPLCVLPDVVELFQSLSASMFFADPITPNMAVALADWLEEIEDAQDHRPFAANPPRFAAAFRYDVLQKLAADVRQAFLLMASRVPERAQGYLRRLLGRRKNDYMIREIMKFRGTVAQAAPAELAALTIAGLIPKEPRKRLSSIRDDAFTHLDSDFLPASPAQGPFLDLLNTAPDHGLSLIRRLVDHAIAARTDGRKPDSDGVTLVFPSGPRFFPWERSYFWSRQAAGCYAVESGLLALEAWAHWRVERGDPPEEVLVDVLGPDGSPAAFILVAVDILISHWPKTMTAAIPFLGSPDLLSLERNRQINDGMPEIDLGGWGAIGSKEPAGPVQLTDLKKRPSRHYSLEALLATFAIDELADRDGLRALLADASTRLGPPEQDDTFAEPRFMARYALNMIDPANWPHIQGGRAYVSPPDEAQHLDALQKKRAPQTLDFGIDASIQSALEDSARSSPELAEHAVDYAQRLSTLPSDTPEDFLRSRKNAIVSSAMILTRDGSDTLLDRHEGWARDVFTQALASTDDNSGSRMREGIRFNPVAIASLGVIHLCRRRGREADRNVLLELAGRYDPHAAQGFGAGLANLRGIDPRLMPALLRCAMVAQIQPEYDRHDPDEKYSRRTLHRERVSAAIQAEKAWLSGSAPEPAWATFPPRKLWVRHKPTTGNGGQSSQSDQIERPSHQLQTQSAAVWFRELTRGSGAADLPWIVSFIDTYAEWTAAANGAGLRPDAEIEGRIDEWNGVFFSFMARAFTRMGADEAVAHVARAAVVPDVSFLDVANELVPAIDRVYFNGLGLDLKTALRLRALLADRLIRTAAWQRERGRSELSVEMKIGPAIATLFFNNYGAFGSASCYLLSKGIDQVDPFLPMLERLIEEGPVPFSGLLTMNLLEVSPRPAHIAFLMSCARTWLRRQPTNMVLWVDGGLGARIARWLETTFQTDATVRSPAHPLRAEMEDVLARLVQIGVAEAHRVEALLVGRV
jgi:hypothetical protein